MKQNLKVTKKKNLKQLLLLGVCAISLATALPAEPAYAQYSYEFTVPEYTERDICITIDTESISSSLMKFPSGVTQINPNYSMVNLDQNPVVISGRTFVPMRAVFEALGCKVEWDQDSKTATVSKDGTTVQLQIGNSQMQVEKNGSSSQVPLDAAPVVINGRTLLPLRAPAEAFGYTVTWDPSARTSGLKYSDGNYVDANGNIYIRDSVTQAKEDDWKARTEAEAARIEAKHKEEEAKEAAEEAAFQAKLQKAYALLDKMHEQYLAGAALSEEQFADEVMKCINLARECYNLAPMKRSALVDEAAEIRAPEIAIDHGHTRPNGTTIETVIPEWNTNRFWAPDRKGVVFPRTASEVLVWEQSSKTTPAYCVRHWMESPFHITYVLNPNVNCVAGIGAHFDGTYTSVSGMSVEYNGTWLEEDFQKFQTY